MGTATVLSNEKCRNDNVNIDENSIEAFFANTVIMLTGATGFLGKALMEKLLRSCPRLTAIFILIRPKLNQTVEQRLKQLMKNPIFDQIKETNPSLCNKIIPIKGDVAQPNLGLSPEDRNLITQKVNIVFHSAATVRFNEPLKVAVNLNTKGTNRMIDLCKDIKNLISVVHVSTAYSNPNRLEVNETIYPSSIEPSTIIDLCDNLDDEVLNELEKKIIKNHPNTYTFTKNLAEQLILKNAKDLPISIVRPSIIAAAMRDPYPGWIDGTFGITGIAIQIGRGVIRTFLGKSYLNLDMVPIDYVVNTIICATWYNTVCHDNTIKVYNCTNNGNPINWGMLKTLVEKHVIKSPLKHLVWYPSCKIISNRFIYNILSFFLHYFPALLIDTFLKILGYKPMMLKNIKYCERMMGVCEHFTMNEFTFSMDNTDGLLKKMQTLDDCNNFTASMKNLNWDTYMEYYILGIKKYILNEDSKTASIGRSRLLVFYWIHQFTQILSIIILLAMTLRITF
ncbi:PREDICTED: putative fatty acyl-CoA reductase CG5065 [Eufriesea mexicana]|uniref:putative fatty acyl-CoA reductase CG5065 n=1 Tax=Eufriesea mexicana TaxID=516756 RepID=UPI00083C68D2|nr:PREDICTED: putative fatty acyl-CoA reductase CG5065 [Eufriesea mexicana]